MPVEIVMPKLGLNAQEGLLVEWYKAEGDTVEKGEPLFSVETEKATMDSEAPESGRLGKILVSEGELVPVKTVLAYLLKEGESEPEDRGQEISPVKVDAGASPLMRTPENVSAVPAGDWVLAAPIARRLAAENGLSLAEVQASLGGAVVHEADIKTFLSEGGRRPAGVQKLSGVRAVIAERMSASLSKTAQFTLHAEMDVTALVVHRQAAKAAGFAPGYNAYLAKALAAVLPDYPYMNAHATADGMVYQNAVNLGLAVDTPEGLKVVVVHDVKDKTLDVIDQEMRALAQQAQTGSIRLEDLQGSTFTITNLGAYGVDRFTPILNYPEVAILGVGQITEKLVIRDGKVAQRFVMSLSLTIDHRLVDGAPAARFLQAVGEALNSAFS